MRGQDLVRFLNAGQELPGWDCHTGSACLDTASATEVLSTCSRTNMYTGSLASRLWVPILQCKKLISCKQSQNNKFACS